MASSIGKIYGPDGDLLAEAKALLVNLPEEAIDEESLEDLGWKIYDEEAEIQESSKDL
jgi:hypothetical protein